MVVTRLWRVRSIRWGSFAIGINIGMPAIHMNVIDVERAARFANEFAMADSRSRACQRWRSRVRSVHRICRRAGDAVSPPAERTHRS